MNVVIISPGGMKLGGGMGTVSKNLHDALSEEPNISVSVVDSRGERGFLLSLFFLFFAIFRLVFILIKNKKNLLHINVSERFSFYRKAIFIVIGKVFKCKLVLHHHGAEFIQCYENSSIFYKKIVGNAISSCDVNIVLGKKWKDFIHVNIDPNCRIEILYNAVPDSYINTNKNHTYTISLIANLSERKGVLVLLESLSALKGEFTFVVQLIGGGDIAHFKAVANSLGVLDVCKFFGWQNRSATKKLLAQSNVLVLPSYDEGLPMVILESMSLDIPVICTPVGSIGEVLKHSENCLFVEVGSSDSLTNAFLQLYNDKALEQKLVNNSRKLFEEKFSMDGYVTNLTKIYSNI